VVHLLNWIPSQDSYHEQVWTFFQVRNCYKMVRVVDLYQINNVPIAIYLSSHSTRRCGRKDGVYWHYSGWVVGRMPWRCWRCGRNIVITMTLCSSRCILVWFWSWSCVSWWFTRSWPQLARIIWAHCWRNDELSSTASRGCRNSSCALMVWLKIVSGCPN
jgi:hypothetical protein